MTDTKRMRDESIEYAEKNLVECAKELLAWKDTGILVNGHVRELASMCATWSSQHDSIKMAETLIERAALLKCSA